MPAIKMHFLGASGTVTGSKFCLETPELNVMIDCGLFQGQKELRQLNRKPLPVPAEEIDLVLLTHGHLDHCGYLPRLVMDGFIGKVFGTAPSLAIAEIILLDTAKIQEEEAEQANREGYGKHHPALPLYTLEDAELAIRHFQAMAPDIWNELSPDIRYRFRLNSHIIGATFIEIEAYGKLFVFSGDVGRGSDLLLRAPEKPEWADFLVLESTYGDRRHPAEDVDGILSELVKRTIHKGGTLVIPSFAVERLQSLMFILWRLYKSNRIPNIPIFIDSPMGKNVLEVFERFMSWHKLGMGEYQAMCNHMELISSYADTWKTIDDPRPKIVIAGSGMVTGGRVLTYLKYLIDQPSTTILLVGYMAEGTRGRQLLEGAGELKFFGKYHPLKAEVHHLESLSAHADQSELIEWLGGIRNIPEQVFLVHGEPAVLTAFKDKLADTYNWRVTIPSLGESISLVC